MAQRLASRTISVTRLGDLGKFLGKFYKQKLYKCFLGYYEKWHFWKTAMNTFWATLRENWATLYSNNWSHWRPLQKRWAFTFGFGSYYKWLLLENVAWRWTGNVHWAKNNSYIKCVKICWNDNIMSKNILRVWAASKILFSSFFEYRWQLYF